MTTYDFTDKAEHDLERIIDYTNKHWGRAQAIEYIDALEELVQTLADNSHMGSARESLSTGLFSFPYQSHMLYYMKKY